MKFAVTLFIFLGSMFSFGQDIIHFKNGSVEKVKVVEVGVEVVKYKRFDHLDGPDRVVAIKDLAMIKYENGMEEFFPDTEELEEEVVIQEVIVEEEEKEIEKNEISEERQLELIEQDLFGNGFFYDVMLGIGAFNKHNQYYYYGEYGSALKSNQYPAVSLGYRFGNKWYFGSSPIYRYGAQVTWGSLTFLIGGFEPRAIISPLGVGFTNVFRFDNNNGLEANLNFSPAVMSELIDGNVSGGGNIVPGIKFRNKIFSFGIDFRYTMLYRDFELSETVNMLTFGFGMKF